MTTERFNVVLQGTTLRGLDVASVGAELARLIKRDTNFATHLLRGQPTKLKSGVDAATGARYIEALERIGVAVRLEPETLEVDAGLSTSPPIANQDRPYNAAPIVGARVAERTEPGGKFRGNAQQRDATVIEPRSTSTKIDTALDAAALAWPRLWARQIDLALCFAIAFGLAALVGAVAALVGATHLLTTANIFVQLAVETLLGTLLIFLVLIGYEALFLAAFGTTLGKAVLGLRVESQSGTKIEFERALRRSLGVLWRGCWAYIGFPVGTLIAWQRSRRCLRKTGSTPWDDGCVTRVAGGPVPLWRAMVGGVIAITAFTLVFGLEAAERREISRQAQASVDKSFGISPSPATTAASNNQSVFDPSTARPTTGGFDASTAVHYASHDANQATTDSDRSDALAQFNLGRKYAEGQGVSQDYAEAVKWWRKAADQGNAQAQTGLGDAYAYGKGVRQDYAEAMQWFRKAADQGYAPAQGILGLMYFSGQGVPQNSAEAVQWFRKSADQGSAESQYVLGRLYVSGQGVAQDYAEAAQWYRKAAEQGYPEAQYNLGGMYATGRGVPQDYARAVQWFRNAADKGVAGAQMALGGVYALGQGVPEDNVEAAKWTRKAADQGMPEAQSVLGHLYSTGLGVPQDYVEAVKWLNLAASRYPASQVVDRDNAVRSRDDVARKMTPAQMAEAQRLASEWKPK